MPQFGKKSFLCPSAVFLSAIVISVLSFTALEPVGAGEPAQDKTANAAPQLCQPSRAGTAIGRCPRCCAKNVSGSECAKCGHPLQAVGMIPSWPRLRETQYDTLLKDVTRTERSIGRSMKGIDENIRNMRSTVTRIRTIDRQIRAMRRR